MFVGKWNKSVILPKVCIARCSVYNFASVSGFIRFVVHSGADVHCCARSVFQTVCIRSVYMQAYRKKRKNVYPSTPSTELSTMKASETGKKSGFPPHKRRCICVHNPMQDRCRFTVGINPSRLIRTDII